MEKTLYTNHPVRCIITGPSECGESVFLSNLILKIINEHDKTYIYSPSLHQDLYQNLIKCSSNYLPVHIKPNILNEADIDIVLDELVKNNDFEKPNCEIEIYERIEELKFPQEFETNSITILDDLNQKEMDDPRAQAMFKRSKHNILSIFIISQDYYELSKNTIRFNSNIFHIFKPNNFRDVLNLYQDKCPMDMTINEFKFITPTCWIEKINHLLSIRLKINIRDDID